ncbi:methylmalonyl-CoA mutase family protein [Candidatus Aminicenantes bacterium AC-708-I09]|nr:methylmalonyl-CoA mutase family protein [Candidatus Aminicenantes bacterium AC-708-I09]
MLIPTLKRRKERKDKFFTSSNIEIKRLYTQEDNSDFNYNKKLGYPGAYPFTRGVYATMYRGRLWTMRQYAGFGTAEESNRRYKYLLSQGQTGLSVAFDLPTQTGLDSNHPLAQGEVGKVGVAIDTLKDMEILFEGIPLDRVSVSMTINATAPIILAMYLALAEKRSIPWDKLSGTIQNDILKEYIARGTYIFPLQPSLKLTIDIFSFCRKYMPLWNFISISGYHIREAGATAVQELAFTFANAITYVKEAIKEGLKVDDFAPRISFFFSSHNNFFEEIAKFRAGRRIWAKIMKEKFNAKNPDSCKLRFHTQTSGVTLTAQQPDNNIVRVTIQALAAVLGGTQSLHTNARDEALALPSEESAQIALRTQQIIAYESGVTDTIDPLGGAYFIEALTDEIEKKVWDYLNKIEEIGGMKKAIETGFIQREIQESAYSFQKKIEKKEEIIVGVNEFKSEHEKINFELLQVPPEIEKAQIKRLEEVKRERDNYKVKEKLSKLKNSAYEKENLIPYIIDAVKAYATIGEIIDSLKEVFGDYKHTAIF